MKRNNLQAIKLCYLRYLLQGMTETEAFGKLERVVGRRTMTLAWCQLV